MLRVAVPNKGALSESAAAVLAGVLLVVLVPGAPALAIGGVLVALALVAAWWRLGAGAPLGTLGVAAVVALVAVAEIGLARTAGPAVPAATPAVVA